MQVRNVKLCTIKIHAYAAIIITFLITVSTGDLVTLDVNCSIGAVSWKADLHVTSITVESVCSGNNSNSVRDSHSVTVNSVTLSFLHLVSGSC